MAQPPLLFPFLPYREIESFLGVQPPEKYSQQGRSIQGMQENGLRLWICDFLLFFVREGYNYKPHRNL